jgi:hypothetical protein
MYSAGVLVQERFVLYGSAMLGFTDRKEEY